MTIRHLDPAILDVTRLGLSTLHTYVAELGTWVETMRAMRMPDHVLEDMYADACAVYKARSGRKQLVSPGRAELEAAAASGFVHTLTLELPSEDDGDDWELLAAGQEEAS